jgi:hypothetical protein
MGCQPNLCRSTLAESASSIPASMLRRTFESSSPPPYAASTWNQAPCAWAIRAHSVSGSMAPASVVPAVATTATSVQPSSAIACAALESAAASIR